MRFGGCLGMFLGAIGGLLLTDRILVWTKMVGRGGCMDGLAVFGVIHWLLLGIAGGAFLGNNVARRIAAARYRAEQSERQREDDEIDREAKELLRRAEQRRMDNGTRR
jgi:hypothetical protein